MRWCQREAIGQGEGPIAGAAGPNLRWHCRKYPEKDKILGVFMEGVSNCKWTDAGVEEQEDGGSLRCGILGILRTVDFLGIHIFLGLLQEGRSFDVVDSYETAIKLLLRFAGRDMCTG